MAPVRLAQSPEKSAASALWALIRTSTYLSGMVLEWGEMLEAMIVSTEHLQLLQQLFPVAQTEDPHLQEVVCIEQQETPPSDVMTLK